MPRTNEEVDCARSKAEALFTTYADEYAVSLLGADADAETVAREIARISLKFPGGIITSDSLSTADEKWRAEATDLIRRYAARQVANAFPYKCEECGGKVDDGCTASKDPESAFLCWCCYAEGVQRDRDEQKRRAEELQKNFDGLLETANELQAALRGDGGEEQP